MRYKVLHPADVVVTGSQLLHVLSALLWL